MLLLEQLWWQEPHAESNLRKCFKKKICAWKHLEGQGYRHNCHFREETRQFASHIDWGDKSFGWFDFARGQIDHWIKYTLKSSTWSVKWGVRQWGKIEEWGTSSSSSSSSSPESSIHPSIHLSIQFIQQSWFRRRHRLMQLSLIMSMRWLMWQHFP